MSRYRLRTLCAAVASFAVVGWAAGQAAQATPSVTAAKVRQADRAAPSGIGLAVGLNRTGNGILTNATYYDRALRSALWDRTPSGLVFHSCYYHVPNGSYVDSVRGRIDQPDGRVVSMSRCAYPRLVKPGVTPAAASARIGAQAAAAAASGGWLQGFEQSGLPAMARLYVKYAVPNYPSVAGAEELQWSALATDANGSSLLQPLIGYGGVQTLKGGVNIPNGSGNYLEMAAYYFWSGNAVAAAFRAVYPQDTIEVSIQSENCSSGGSGCTWVLDAEDDNNSASSEFSVGTSPAFTTVIGGMYEVYNAKGCQTLFANHHLVFRNLSVGKYSTTTPFTAIEPHFVKRLDNQQCSMNTAFTSTSGDITWTP